jgi:hypothetical protein
MQERMPIPTTRTESGKLSPQRNSSIIGALISPIPPRPRAFQGSSPAAYTAPNR